MSLIRVLSVVFVFFAVSPAPTFADTGDDPLGSPIWVELKERYLGEGAKVEFDPRVKVTGPKTAEDSMNVPVGIRIEGLTSIKRVLVIADLNPIIKVIEFVPSGAKPALHFRMKLQQGSPVRALAQTSDGVWHAGGIWIDASGGGCTAPSVGRSSSDWTSTLGQVQTKVWENPEQSRVKVHIMHPMDTGLAAGIPAFYIERLSLQDETGREWMKLDTFEPISENPVFTFDFPGKTPPGLRLVGRDIAGNLINAKVSQ